jgi:hypothetical protein
VNRRQKLELALEGTAVSNDTVEWMAQLPEGMVDELAAALKAARKAGQDDERRERAARRERKRERGPDELAADTTRMISNGLGRRATEDLDALGRLWEIFRDGSWIIDRAILALRKDGISDSDIGMALGYDPRYARQEVHRRWGKRPAHPDTPQVENAP